MMIWLTTIKTTETFNFYWILKNQLSIHYSTRQVCIYLLDLVAQSKHTLMHHANHIVLTMKNTSIVFWVDIHINTIIKDLGKPFTNNM